MNNFTLNVNAGGVFSKFMFIIQNIQRINPNFDSVYINNLDSRSLTGSENIFNNILKQDNTNNQAIFECKHLGNYSKSNPIENSLNLSEYKKIISKLQFTDNFNNKFNKINSILNIDESFIGVHIRLCDMNILHSNDYGILTYNDFLTEIKKHVTTNTKLFISSDNIESISKLKHDLDNKIYYVKNFIRADLEIENTYDLQIKYFKDYQFWQEAFIDMLLLAKCGKLICRTSNLNNASVIYSNTIKKIIRL